MLYAETYFYSFQKALHNSHAVTWKVIVTTFYSGSRKISTKILILIAILENYDVNLKRVSTAWNQAFVTLKKETNLYKKSWTYTWKWVDFFIITLINRKWVNYAKKLNEIFPQRHIKIYSSSDINPYNFQSLIYPCSMVNRWCIFYTSPYKKGAFELIYWRYIVIWYAWRDEATNFLN